MVGLRSWRVTVRVPRVNKKNDTEKKNQKTPTQKVKKATFPPGIRTQNPLLRRQMPYPLGQRECAVGLRLAKYTAKSQIFGI